MDFKEYPSYKDSGVEWLGEVPADWQVIPSKFYFTERQEKAELADKQLTASQKFGIVFQEDYMAENGRVMVVIKNPEILKKVRPKDFVISMRSFQGGLELSNLEGCISSAYVMLKPNLELVDTEYYKYLFKSPRYIQALQSTSTLIRDGQALRFNNFSQVKLVLPPKEEQTKIVSFLDSETSRIDNLIAKQEKLIKLLEEHRKSIISHAVTKGLDPNVPMKDSGVEWLGEIPEHWEQKPIWSMFTRTKRTNHPNELLLSVYRDYGVIPKNSRDDNHNRASEDLTPYQLVLPNDLVINKMKAWQGSIAISEYKGIVSPAYYIYEPKQSYCSKYIHHLIRSVYFIQSYKNFSKGIRVNQWDLEHDSFTHINLLLPPLTEQNQIVSFLDSENSRIENLIAKQEKLIEKLKEYRASIISYAVTGKIDVRDLVA